MSSFLRNAHPWGLLLVALAIVVANLMGAGKFVHRALWAVAGVVAVVGVVSEWRK